MGDARVGFALTGSFCTLEKAIRAMEETAREYPNMVPILSETTGATDTRFGRAADFRQAAEEICGHGAVESVREAEPIGPQKLLDVLVIAPATGNTIAKLAAGITDTVVTMAAKSHLRNGRPVVIAMASNDGLSAGARNIGELLVRKHYYFVPFGQDSAILKPNSLIADFDKIPDTVDAALRGEQLQPILLKS